MNKLCFLFSFIIYSIGYSQTLEEHIYTASETFIANQNESSLQLLITKENAFKSKILSQDEQLALVFLQSHKGYYQFEQSKLKEAITTYEDALNRFNKNKLSTFSDFDIIENCLNPLGNLYIKTGDYTNAVSIINQYIFLAKKNKNTKHQISGAINLSKLYYTLGKHETVIEITSKALNIPNLDNSRKQKLIEINIDSQIALNLISEPEEIPKPSTYQKSNEFQNNYKIKLKQGNYFQALDVFKKYKTQLFKKNIGSRDLAQLYIEEAQLYYLLQNFSEALNNLHLAIKTLLPNFNTNRLPDKNLLFAENKFIDIFDLYAECQTNHEIALQSFDLSFHVSNLLRKSWTSQESKILNETNNRNRSEKCVTILFNSYTQTKNRALLFKALQYSENNKTSILKNMAQKKLRLLQYPNDSLLIKEFNLLKEQERVTNLLIKERLSKNKASKINTLSIKLSNISLQIKALKKDISKKYLNNKNTLSLDVLQGKLLEDDAILTEYFYGKNNLYQFIVSSSNIALNQIPLNETNKKSIINFIHLFDDASIINNNISDYTKQAFNMYKFLNFEALNSNKNVIVVADGLLNFIPFEALLTHKTETTSFSKMPFIVSDRNIAYSTNIFFYTNEVQANKNNKVLGFFPVFKNTNQTLTYSINEASAIEKEMSSNLFMDTHATKANFIKEASNYDILHLSTHANSGDLITPASISFYDDMLFLNELYSLDIKANLVVLSACETGIGTLYKAEGAMSIARGFQFSGVKNLLFSLWQINDLSTSQIMQLFYKDYNKHLSAFIANHNSKIQYLQNESIGNAKKSPYYWSAFVYYGSLTKPVSNYNLIYIFFGILIASIIVLLILKLKKHGKNTSRISS